VPVLASQQRKILEDACNKGRRASEQAVRAGLTSLAMTAERPPAHLNEEDRQLRRGLRAKARQLGDEGDDLDLLVAECAYEHWHRLLFARFLAENNLLIHPEYHAPVTLEDCDELAGSLGEPDGWSVAARFAAEILPGIFRLDDPCVRLRLAPEGRLALESIVADLPAEVFAADDALGWVYQFWQKDKKEEVNDSERKIGGADLGPVTQLFTEHYMVRFLLENSLGAWWAARHPDSPIVTSFEYLRLNDEGEPSAGTFDGWPDRVAEVTVMDPCCGSGHFLVEAFSMLSLMRAEEEVLAPIEAQDAVLRDNLFGLELDPRCVQIAMFNIALQAWRTGRGWRQLPVPNIACSGIPVKAPVEEWKALAGGDSRLESALVRLHILFRDAETLGSLIDPHGSLAPVEGQLDFTAADWSAVAPLMEQAATSEARDPAATVFGVDAARGAAAMASLTGRFTLVTTNPPFLSLGRAVPSLYSFAERRHPLAKANLATMFLERGLTMTNRGGHIAFVMPEDWLFLFEYRRLREAILSKRTLSFVARLGPGAFSTNAIGSRVRVVLIVIGESAPGATNEIALVDTEERAGDYKGRIDVSERARRLRRNSIGRFNQTAQARNPGAVILADASNDPPLSEICDISKGLSTGDGPSFVRYFWEQPSASDGIWEFLQGAPTERDPGGRTAVILWEDERGRLAQWAASVAHLNHAAQAWRLGKPLWGRRGVAVALMGGLLSTDYLGDRFDSSVAAVVPRNEDDLTAIRAFFLSDAFADAVRSLNTKLSVEVHTLRDLPFDIDYWRAIVKEGDPPPEPQSNDPTQWLFKGRPEASTVPLQVAVARLVGYRWPEQSESDDLDGFADADGIVCLPSVSGEPPAADRLQQLVGAAFGPSRSPAKQKELLQGTGSKKKNLSDWLRDDFFRQHCALFGHRPFVWHIWDGQRDGFAALVNYHRLDRKTLEKLTYSYLGDWIERQRAEVRDDKAGAEARLTAASKLRGSLELILDGEPPYDIYVRWKSLAEQPIGWDPDVNDGVRVNVRPFVEASVLRSSFNIHWRKDRGKNLDGSERLNNLHLTTAEKRAARGGSR